MLEFTCLLHRVSTQVSKALAIPIHIEVPRYFFYDMLGCAKLFILILVYKTNKETNPFKIKAASTLFKIVY